MFFLTPFSPTKVSSGPDTLLSMSNTMDLTYMKALESFRNGRSPVWDRYSASHTRKECKIFKSFSLVFFDSFFANKSLQRTKLLSDHIKHDKSKLLEGP